MQTSIVFPCFNEKKNLAKLIIKCKKMNEHGIETIIVNNGSYDGSKNFLNNLKMKNDALFKIINIKKNIGYGHGIKVGLKKTRGDIIGWTHADLQTDPFDFYKIIKFIKKNNLNKRCFFKGKRYGRNFFDLAFTYGMQTIFSIIMLQKFEDINAQPNIFFRKDLNLILKGPDDFSFDIYTYLNFKKLKYDIHRFNVKFYKRKSGYSKSSENIIMKLATILKYLKYLIRLRLKI